jgi:hypothetical protein
MIMVLFERLFFLSILYIMCGGQTELQKTLVVFQFTSPGAYPCVPNDNTCNLETGQQ